MGQLNSRHALITGGGSGIGAAIGLALAEAGAKVTIAGRDLRKLEDLSGQRENIFAVTCDVRDEKSVARMYAKAVGQFGPLDIVIANAGAVHSAPIGKTTLSDWQAMIDTNLTGVFLTLQQGLAHMETKSTGRVIAVSSTAGLKGYKYVAPYCAAKHGVIGLVRALAAETAGAGPTVNAVCPGFTETDLLDRSIDNIVAKTGLSETQARKSLSAGNLIGRFVQPEEIAACVLWLVGEGSGAITGQAISVSGGETW